MENTCTLAAAHVLWDKIRPGLGAKRQCRPTLRTKVITILCSSFARSDQGVSLAAGLRGGQILQDPPCRNSPCNEFLYNPSMVAEPEGIATHLYCQNRALPQLRTARIALILNDLSR